MTARGFFVTGTDTGVGKTLVTAALLVNAASRGLRAAGLKPVAAGCVRRAGQLVNDDALLLQAHGNPPLDYGSVNPVALEPGIAPHVAAARAGQDIRAGALADQVRRVAAGAHDVVLVEGAGGWLVPINATETLADLARLLGYPVILVVGMRLGCLNHALLSVAAIRAAGLELAGWVANSTGPPMEAFEENLEALDSRLPALRLGAVPFLSQGVTPDQVNTWLDGTSLFGVR